jgi:cyclic pyranopterin phosphate synthase
LVKLYAFDEVDQNFDLVPLSARRALDAIGMKLSLQAFQSLPLENRARLAEAGSGATVDLETARTSIVGAEPPPEPFEVALELPSNDAPSNVIAAFAKHGPIPSNVWTALSALDRYALKKVADKKRPERLRAAYEEIIGQSQWSSHIKPEGGVRMVSISEKSVTQRRAQAECWIKMSKAAFEKLHSSTAPKGDVLGTARLAGIMATKRTSDLIPLCHPLALEHADVRFEEHQNVTSIRVICSVEVRGRTGVEMEAMVGAQIAC